jgi:hypothetical protein
MIVPLHYYQLGYHQILKQITEEWGKTQNGKLKTKKNLFGNFMEARKNFLYTE